MRLESVQSLRGLAAITVLFYHLEYIERSMIDRFSSDEVPLVGGMLLNGFAGVDLFFVLSGFIIAYVTGRASPDRHHLLSFLFARAARIYPPWWLFASMIGLYFWVAYGAPWAVERLAEDGTSPAWHLFASYALLPQDGFPLLGVGWTLVHEMHFYVIFSLLLMLPYKLRVGALVTWALVVLAGGLAGLAEPFARDLMRLFFSPLTLEFLMGAAAALLLVNGYRFQPALFAILGLFGFGTAMVFHTLDPEWTLSWGRVIWFGIPSAILTYGLVGLDLKGQYRAPPGFNSLGDWSYSLYLSHMLTLSAIDRTYHAVANVSEAYLGVPQWMADLLRVGLPGRLDNLFLLVSGAVASIIVAWLAYRFFEQPVLVQATKLRRRLFDDKTDDMAPQPIRAAVW